MTTITDHQIAWRMIQSICSDVNQPCTIPTQIVSDLFTRGERTRSVPDEDAHFEQLRRAVHGDDSIAQIDDHNR
ncbi:MAG: hypothetical protein Q9M13_03605 [Mariprofundales bacterium]|nr:hypothetical protein [Mariprofundales bacterium]